MFKRKKKKTGCETPKFRKPTVPPQIVVPPMPPTSGSNAVKPKQSCLYKAPCNCNTTNNSKPNRIVCDSNGVYVEYEDGSMLKINNENAQLIDKYGNKCTYNAHGDVLYESNSPTYDELYEHWLNTKQNIKED